jgi:hyperosmotically inducible protein
MKRFTTLFLLVALTMLAVLPSSAAPNTTDEFQLVEKVRKELVTLPFFSVFDNFSFNYKDGVVTLMGQVTRPTLKSSAERVVARIAGVEQVINNIEVLPLSPFDDRIRLATYRAIYSQPGLDRLAFMANPPVRIIVKNGNVTLEGVVLNEGDKTRAFLAANGVPNVFSVTNNLRTEIAKR